MNNLNSDKMDNLFQTHFSQTQVTLDNADALWNAIEQERTPATKRPVLWWFLGGAILLGSILWWLYPSTTSPKQEVAPVVNQPIAFENTNTKSDWSLNQTAIQKADRVVAAVSKKTPLIKENQTKTVVAPKRKSGTRTNTISNTTPIKSIIKPTLISPKKETTISSNLNQNQEIVTIKEQAKPILETPNQVLSTKFVDTKLSSIENKSIVDISTRFKTEHYDQTKWDKCQVKQPGTFFVKGYGQASMAMEKITDTNDALTGESPTYIEAWQEKISPFMSYSGGVQLGYTFPWQGYISGGLAYQHFQTKYEETQRVVEQITIYDEMAYFYIDAAGETVWVADSVSVTNIYDRTETHPNNHKMWHIPIQLGYIGQRGNFRFGANVEALVNISKSYTGYFMESNRNIIALDNANDADYMSTNLGLSVSVGLHLGYMLGDHWEVYASPRVRANNTSFLADSQQLKITRNFTGLRGGLVYHF